MTSQEIVEGFASTTGAIMTDTIPLLIYLLGFAVTIFAFLFFYKPIISGIRKIFK
jgi:hypothetical protein